MLNFFLRQNSHFLTTYAIYQNSNLSKHTAATRSFLYFAYELNIHSIVYCSTVLLNLIGITKQTSARKLTARYVHT